VVVVACFTVISALVHTHLTGDAPEYVGAVFTRLRSDSLTPAFWDAGHLLWRPLGYVLSLLRSGIDGTPPAQSTWKQISWTFIALSCIGGLICAVAAPLWLRKVGCTRFSCIAASVILVASNAFLDYYNGGTAYSSATGFLFLGLFLIACRGFFAAAAGGICLAIAVLLWLPFVLALPGAFLSPLLLLPDGRTRVRQMLIALLCCAVVGIGVYGAVMGHLGIRTPTDAIAWIESASHGVSSIFGLPRMAVGFARSFINIGADGAALKRFVLHDPLNPVSVGDLVRLGLWKIALFYVVLLLLGIQLVRARAWLRLAFCVIVALPVLAFAIAWQGGDTERYLALYPAFLLAFATVVGAGWSPMVLRLVLVGFVAILAVVNINAHSRWAFAAQEDDVVRRTSSFNEQLLPPNSIVVMPTLVDRTISYFLSGAQDRTKIRATLKFFPLIQQGAASKSWRQDFARECIGVWRAGGRVWLSKRVLARKPDVDWGWAEGEDSVVSWSDFPRFFSGFVLGTSVGGVDGFVELPPSPTNQALMLSTAN